MEEVIFREEAALLLAGELGWGKTLWNASIPFQRDEFRETAFHWSSMNFVWLDTWVKPSLDSLFDSRNHKTFAGWSSPPRPVSYLVQVSTRSQTNWNREKVHVHVDTEAMPVVLVQCLVKHKLQESTVSGTKSWFWRGSIDFWTKSPENKYFQNIKRNSLTYFHAHARSLSAVTEVDKNNCSELPDPPLFLSGTPNLDWAHDIVHRLLFQVRTWKKDISGKCQVSVVTGSLIGTESLFLSTYCLATKLLHSWRLNLMQSLGYSGITSLLCFYKLV